MMVMICAKYQNNPSRNVDATERKSQGQKTLKIQVKVYVVITCDITSHAIDHLYQIWKESILNCRCYRADTKA